MKYVIGIDLGTTNSALAYTEIRPDADPFDTPEVRLMDIPQLVNPGEVRDEPCCPPRSTFLARPIFQQARLRSLGMQSQSLSPAASRRNGAWRMPAAWWPRQNHGSRMPASTAPAPILPWNAPEGVPKLSPVDASSRYLDHLRRAVGSEVCRCAVY